ncbi:Carbonic anhydrase [Fasciolopsis buskii]|uniref:Carbonic anhydrase n=1 Tax=Fasciolopsis buskii TaxID=27845 RepID=A0A8E0RSR1_9TREM|nr:Carbonic anhydrase [Fasciolopsis buski]
MERIIKGALAFTRGGRQDFLKHIKTNYKPLGILLSCVDARVYPSKILGANPGELYVVRNAGNFVPENGAGEAGTILSTLELGCLRGSVKDIIICGHSDCKAMHLLQSFGSEAENHKSDKNSASPLQKWVSQNGIKGWNKWRAKSDSIEFPAMKDHLTLNMHADQVKKLEPVDVLSQINVLQQMSNIYSYPLLSQKLMENEVRVHGLWFDIHTGQMYQFSRNKQAFLPINEETLSELVRESSS